MFDNSKKLLSLSSGAEYVAYYRLTPNGMYYEFVGLTRDGAFISVNTDPLTTTDRVCMRKQQPRGFDMVPNISRTVQWKLLAGNVLEVGIPLTVLTQADGRGVETDLSTMLVDLKVSLGYVGINVIIINDEQECPVHIMPSEEPRGDRFYELSPDAHRVTEYRRVEAFAHHGLPAFLKGRVLIALGLQCILEEYAQRAFAKIYSEADFKALCDFIAKHRLLNDGFDCWESLTQPGNVLLRIEKGDITRGPQWVGFLPSDTTRRWPVFFQRGMSEEALCTKLRIASPDYLVGAIVIVTVQRLYADSKVLQALPLATILLDDGSTRIVELLQIATAQV